ncbi:MAG: NAD(P)-dependent oxidoreductase [Elainella sp. Prado103]|jgi:dTDP-4-dehydrorhamnose reductase|nr:NAD(P)-dependent oxidoreductase [Elainella sp. Prado103]
MAKKLLITGASGFLGWYLSQQSHCDSSLQPDGWQVYGTYHRHAVEIPGVTLSPIDLLDATAVRALLDAIQPDAVIHTAALSSPNACQLDPDLSYRLNVVATCQLAEYCADRAIPLVFTSSEQVFDGKQPPYRETDPVNPINRYGEHKALAETEIRSRYPAATICRMPLMFGAAPTADSFLQPWIRTWRSGQAISLFTDEIRNPVHGADAAQGLLLALAQSLTSTAAPILHLGGVEPISRYDFGQLLIEILQLPGCITACRQAEVSMAAPRPLNVCLNSDLAFRLGYAPMGIRAALMELKPLL